MSLLKLAIQTLKSDPWGWQERTDDSGNRRLHHLHSELVIQGMADASGYLHRPGAVCGYRLSWAERVLMRKALRDWLQDRITQRLLAANNKICPFCGAEEEK